MGHVGYSRERRQRSHPTPRNVLGPEDHQETDQPLVRLVHTSTPTNLLQQRPRCIQGQIFRGLEGLLGSGSMVRGVCTRNRRDRDGLSRMERRCRRL